MSLVEDRMPSGSSLRSQVEVPEQRWERWSKQLVLDPEEVTQVWTVPAH